MYENGGVIELRADNSVIAMLRKSVETPSKRLSHRPDFVQLERTGIASYLVGWRGGGGVQGDDTAGVNKHLHSSVSHQEYVEGRTFLAV